MSSALVAITATLTTAGPDVARHALAIHRAPIPSDYWIVQGNHLIRHSSTLQTTIGLSSAEAEYYAMTKGAAYALGIQSLLKDWLLDIEIELYSDSSSAIAFSKRRGLGKNRHIATRYLWLQERIALKHLKVLKVGNSIEFIVTKVDFFLSYL